MDNPYLGDGRTCYPIAESQPAAQRLHGGPKLDAKGVEAKKAGHEPGFRLTPDRQREATFRQNRVPPVATR
jgi:hypothetical protein